MGWRGRFDAPRPRRPKLRSLAADERDRVSATMAKEIARSPILTAFDVQVQPARGRFYLRWLRNPPDSEDAGAAGERISRGRITPVDSSDGPFLLEVEYGRGSWSLVAGGSPLKLVRTVAGDTLGTFHGLGTLDKSLRRAAKQGVERLPVKRAAKMKFVFTETNQTCSVQDALYHYFGMPIFVIAQPTGWYSYHRRPTIVEASKDRTRVLVRFLSSSLSGSFGGTCLYLNRDGRWGAYTIRPNQSDDIATAEAWLVKRRWVPW